MFDNQLLNLANKLDLIRFEHILEPIFDYPILLLFVNFGEKEGKYRLDLMQNIRKAGIRCELYPDSVKMKKQMAYADKKNIPYVAIIGENEMNNKYITVKEMESGIQKQYSSDELIKLLKAK